MQKFVQDEEGIFAVALYDEKKLKLKINMNVGGAKRHGRFSSFSVRFPASSFVFKSLCVLLSRHSPV